MKKIGILGSTGSIGTQALELIDDINFHKKDAFYLNRYGYSFGFHQTGFPRNTSNLNIESKYSEINFAHIPKTFFARGVLFRRQGSWGSH